MAESISIGLILAAAFTRDVYVTAGNENKTFKNICECLIISFICMFIFAMSCNYICVFLLQFLPSIIRPIFYFILFFITYVYCLYKLRYEIMIKLHLKLLDYKENVK